MNSAARPDAELQEELVVHDIWDGGHGSFWAFAGMWVAMIALWGLLIWAVYALTGHASRHHVTHHHDDHPSRILDQRLAAARSTPMSTDDSGTCCHPTPPTTPQVMTVDSEHDSHGISAGLTRVAGAAW